MFDIQFGPDWTHAVYIQLKSSRICGSWKINPDFPSGATIIWTFVILEWTDRINETLKSSLRQSGGACAPRVAQLAALCGATCGLSGTLKWNRAVIDVVSYTWAFPVAEEGLAAVWPGPP